MIFRRKWHYACWILMDSFREFYSLEKHYFTWEKKLKKAAKLFYNKIFYFGLRYIGNEYIYVNSGGVDPTTEQIIINFDETKQLYGFKSVGDGSLKYVIAFNVSLIIFIICKKILSFKGWGYPYFLIFKSTKLILYVLFTAWNGGVDVCLK